MAEKTDQHAYQSIKLVPLWLSLAAGPIIWSIYLIVGYALISLACERGILSFNIMGVSAVRLIEVVFTLLMASVVLFAGLWAYRGWQRIRNSESETDDADQAEGRFRFMALSAVILNGLFFVTILVSLVPLLLLEICT